MTVAFETNIPGSQSDPDGLLPAGWSATTGDSIFPTTFTGSWTYDDQAVDLDPTDGVGEFLFSDPSLTIDLSAGGIDYVFQLDRISTSYSDVPGDWSRYVVYGSSTDSPLAGVASEEIVIYFGQMSPLPTALIAGPDSPDPLAGSPWEDGSGFSALTVEGTNGLSGPDESYYVFNKVLGSHGAASPAVPEPGGALLFAAGVGVVAAARRRRR
jgi:hypothetical protein